MATGYPVFHGEIDLLWNLTLRSSREKGEIAGRGRPDSSQVDVRVIAPPPTESHMRWREENSSGTCTIGWAVLGTSHYIFLPTPAENDYHNCFGTITCQVASWTQKRKESFHPDHAGACKTYPGPRCPGGSQCGQTDPSCFLRLGGGEYTILQADWEKSSARQPAEDPSQP